MYSNSFVQKLPPEIVSELHARIRKNFYGNQKALSDWIKELGYSCSKSSMCRYSKALKANDGVEGTANSHALFANVGHSAEPSHRLNLMHQELGELEVKRHELLCKIRELSNSIHNPIEPL